jgi:hypothetical protein
LVLSGAAAAAWRAAAGGRPRAERALLGAHRLAAPGLRGHGRVDEGRAEEPRLVQGALRAAHLALAVQVARLQAHRVADGLVPHLALLPLVHDVDAADRA